MGVAAGTGPILCEQAEGRGRLARDFCLGAHFSAIFRLNAQFVLNAVFFAFRDARDLLCLRAQFLLNCVRFCFLRAAHDLLRLVTQVCA
jgi:hypothetical protein